MSDTSSIGRFSYRQGGEKRAAHGSWYRGPHCNYIPSRANLSEPNALDDYVLSGWMPDKPFISKQDPVTAFGSCFARYVTQYLYNWGYNCFTAQKNLYKSHIVWQGAGIVNVATLYQQFAWAFGEIELDGELWYGTDGNQAANTQDIREETRHIFNQTNVFILTLGLSEVWYNKLTGETSWRAIPKDKFDPNIHGFRVLSMAQTKQCLSDVWRLIQKHRPDAKAVFTLSPVPLVATFRPVSCLTANEVSKSILRAALDEFLRDNQQTLNKSLYYFPSYEIIRCFVEDAYKEDNRHVRDGVIDLAMTTFRKYFCLCRNF